MFFNAVKATLLMSAVELVSSAVTSQPESVSSVKRHYHPRPNHDCTLPNGECQQYSGDAGFDGYGSSSYQDFGPHSGGVVANSGAIVNGGVTASGGVAANGGIAAGGGVAANGGIAVNGGVAANGGIAASGGVAANGGVTANHGVGVSGGAVATVGLQAMARGWASLTPSFQKFQTTVSAGASIEVVLQAAIALGAQVRFVSSQYGSCGCSPSSQTRSEFQSMAIQFFISMQSALQVCHQTFAYAWEARFKSVFEQFSVAFVSLKAIAASIQVDLAVALQHARINVQLFATVGLNLSVLLQSNLSLGGLINGKLPFTKY